jgi:archaellum component FlaC
LKDKLNLNKGMAPTELPPLPMDVTSEPIPVDQNLDAVADKMENITDRLNQIESPLPTPQPMQSGPKPGAKVFIRLDKYTEIINTINSMESKINELKNAIGKINDLRNAEQQLVDSWNKLVDEAQAKVNDVSSKLPPANR